MNDKKGDAIPLGLGMALFQNPDAFFYFNGLDPEKQSQIIDGAKDIRSREEMRSYVDGLTSMD